MLIKLLITGLFSFSFSTGCMAQTEKELITATIDLYFDGWATSDTGKVGRAMHPSCHLKFFRDSVFRDISRQEYLSRFGQPKQREKNVLTTLEFLDITGNIAQAKTRIETEKRVFIDYFNLIKTNEGWFIVDKISTSTEKKP